MVSARAVAVAVTAHLDTVNGITAYLSRGPVPPAGRSVIVHPDTGAATGPLGDPWRDLVVEVQTTCVGVSPEQALWTHDRVAERMTRAVLSIDAGYDTHPVTAVPGTQRPVSRDDDLPDPLYTVTSSWRVHARPH